jgi:tetratricopeptide (TPR) repeat protein
LDRKQPDAAIATLMEALRLKHDVRRAHVALGVAWEAKGDFEQALARYRQALGMNPEDRRALPALGYLPGVMGRRKEAQEIASQLEDMNARVRNCAFQVAVVYSGLQQHDTAIDWLEQAYRTKQAALPSTAIEYRFHSLRQHPRFQAMQPVQPYRHATLPQLACGWSNFERPKTSQRPRSIVWKSTLVAILALACRSVYYGPQPTVSFIRHEFWLCFQPTD